MKLSFYSHKKLIINPWVIRISQRCRLQWIWNFCSNGCKFTLCPVYCDCSTRVQMHGHDHSDEDVEDVNIHGVSEHSQPLLKKYPADETKEKKKKKKKRNINVQAACLHVLGDSIQSIGVTIGATVIWYNPNFKVIDPICTLLFSIDATSLEHGLCEIDEVVAIHELHIWAITVGKVLLACHVRIRREVDADMVLDKVVDFIKREYNINHVTIQIERE
ncbi:putative cation efflux protein [Helianthus anomalus]